MQTLPLGFASLRVSYSFAHSAWEKTHPAVVEERLPFMPDPDQDHDGFNRSKSGHGHSQ